MRSLAPRTRERSQQLLSGRGYTRPILLGAPGKCMKAIKQSKSSQLARAQRLTFARPTPHPRAAMIRRLSARTARRKACADTVSRQGWRIPSGGSPSRTRVSCANTSPVPIGVSNAKWRTSQPSARNGSRSQNEPHVRGVVVVAAFSVCLA
jgi:hypothetical protein